jgi:hypothetical protein
MVGELWENRFEYLTITCRPHHGPNVFYSKNSGQKLEKSLQIGDILASFLTFFTDSLPIF